MCKSRITNTRTIAPSTSLENDIHTRTISFFRDGSSLYSTIEDGDWDENDDLEGIDRINIELAHVSGILGDILRQVYRPRTITSEVAAALARRLQRWSENLAPDLTIDHLLKNKEMPENTRAALLRMQLGHLNCIILLTRPFFVDVVARAVAQRNQGGDFPSQTTGTIERLAKACVLAATRSVEITQSLFVENHRPQRPTWLIYFFFIAGLVLLLDAYRDKSLLLNPSIACVKIIMHSYAPFDPSADRYHQVFEKMEAAIIGEGGSPGSRDVLGYLLYGKGLADSAGPGNLMSGNNVSVEDVDVCHFLNEQMTNLNAEGDTGSTVPFDFDHSSYWDPMMLGDPDFRGLLLNPEY